MEPSPEGYLASTIAGACAEESRAAGDALAYNLLLRVFMILDAVPSQ